MKCLPDSASYSSASLLGNIPAWFSFQIAFLQNKSHVGVEVLIVLFLV